MSIITLYTMLTLHKLHSISITFYNGWTWFVWVCLYMPQYSLGDRFGEGLGSSGTRRRCVGYLTLLIELHVILIWFVVGRGCLGNWGTGSVESVIVAGASAVACR